MMKLFGIPLAPGVQGPASPSTKWPLPPPPTLEDQPYPSNATPAPTLVWTSHWVYSRRDWRSKSYIPAFNARWWRQHDPPHAVDDALVVFTDAAFSWDELQAGAGVAVWNKRENAWIGRGYTIPWHGFSNDDAEMFAIYEGLKVAQMELGPGDRRIEVKTDSQMCLDEIWVARTYSSDWRGNMYRVTDVTQGVANLCTLIECMYGVTVKFSWVKSHMISFGNELADRIAHFAEEELPQGLVTVQEVRISNSSLEAMKQLATEKVSGRREKLTPSHATWETPIQKILRESLRPEDRAKAEDWRRRWDKKGWCDLDMNDPGDFLNYD